MENVSPSGRVLRFDFVDFRDPENVKKAKPDQTLDSQVSVPFSDLVVCQAMKPNTKLVFSETPANPVLHGPWIFVAVL